MTHQADTLLGRVFGRFFKRAPLSVAQLLERRYAMPQGEVCVTGWLVAIGGELHLIAHGEVRRRRESPRVRLTDRNLIYAVRAAISPLSGESFVFHPAMVTGVLQPDANGAVALDAYDIQIREKGQPGMWQVDLRPGAVAAAKEKFEALLQTGGMG